MSQKIYYKVVTENLQSVCRFFVGWQPEFTIQYQINNFVSSINNTPLYVFKDYGSASDFTYLMPQRYGNDLYIYSCIIKGKCKYIPLLNDAAHGIFIKLSKIIQKKQSIKHFIRTYSSYMRQSVSIPSGTVAVKQVKLLKLRTWTTRNSRRRI